MPVTFCFSDVDCDRVWNSLPKHYIVQSKVKVKPKHRNQIDVFDCLQLCADDANCKSVDYYYGAKKCWMWSISINDDMITRDYYSFKANGNYDHYEPFCKGNLTLIIFGNIHIIDLVVHCFVIIAF